MHGAFDFIAYDCPLGQTGKPMAAAVISDIKLPLDIINRQIALLTLDQHDLTLRQIRDSTHEKTLMR